MQKHPDLSRITLGTAQLGLPYGIANQHGLPTQSVAERILCVALQSGITSFDTAAAYGESETRIGDFLAARSDQGVFLTTKLPALKDNTAKQDKVGNFLWESLHRSLEKLHRQSIELLMVHSFQDFRSEQEAYRDFFRQAKEKRWVQRSGISIYDPFEAEELINLNNTYPTFDAIQLPLNLFDQRFLGEGLLNKLKANDFLIFSRSVFLQGLFFLTPENLPAKVQKAYPVLRQLQQLSEKYGKTVREIATGFVNSFEQIDSILLGVDTPEQLSDNVRDFQQHLPGECISEIRKTFSEIPAEIIDPRKWK